MFLTNWLILQIVAAGVTGAVEYPSAADFFMNFDSNNSLYFTGGSKNYVSNLILYKGETEYPVYNGSVSNIYISDPASYVSYIQLCGETYVTNTVDVQAVVNPGGTFPTLTQDEYNKLTLNSLNNIQTSRLTLNSNTYTANGPVSKFFVNEAGTYEVSATGSDAYAIVKKTVAAPVTLNEADIAWNDYSQAQSTEQKITASDKASNDWFGYSVSIDGDYAIVGARGDDTSTGAAYIYTRNASTGVWGGEQKITASDKASNDEFGRSVSLSGDYAIVGAPSEDPDDISSAGSAYIFKRNGTTWSQQQKITASDKASSDQFGYSVSLSGDYAIVGAYLEDPDNIGSAGAAYIFKREGTTWSQQQKITASDKASSDWFGWSVSLSGDYAIVGAHQEDAGGSNAGSAYIFKRNGTTWSQQQKIQASDRASSDNFGYSVSLSGDYAIVGARFEDPQAGNIFVINAGAAYIFKREGTTWSQQQKITASDKASSDQFGTSVSLSGDYAIVGASVDDSFTGAAYIFKRTGTTWAEIKKIQASDKASSDQFGWSVSLSGDYAIVGAFGDDSSTGAAYIYKREVPSPKLTYDTYNKLTLSNVFTSYSSTLRYESNTYDIGSASTIIIRDPGRYEIATTDNENFLSLNSNVTGQTVTQVGVVPTLAYDGLNTLVLSNVSTGSYNTFLEGSNVLACATDLTTYPVPRSGITGTFTYSARSKTSSTFAFTNDVSITDYYKTYQYPPIDGTTTGLTSSTTSATWTISGVQYSTESSVAGTPYNTFDNSITSGFDSTSSTGDITITFESAKTIRKYIVWPYDSTAPVSTPGGSTDPTLSTDGTFRPKSWVLKGSNDGTNWTDLDTVTNQPPSIYGDVHSISSPASYQYYKLSVTANNGGSGLKIGEWQLWGDA